MYALPLLCSAAMCYALLFAPMSVTGSIPQAPVIDLDARVKQHRNWGGDLVSGMEHLRKIIVSWAPISGAAVYEVCHMCEIVNGEITVEGARTEVSTDNTCNGRPCMVLKEAPLGRNVFHARVKVGSEWSPWSEQRNFNVEEPGTVAHEEL